MLKIETIFKKMLLIVKEALGDRIDDKGNIPKISRNPKFSDVKVVTLALAAEFLSMDSENRLFDLIKDSTFFLRMASSSVQHLIVEERSYASTSIHS